MEEKKELNEEVKEEQATEEKPQEEPKQEEPKKEKPKKEKKQLNIDIKKHLTVLLGFAALVLLAITHVVVIFCRVNPRIFRGIMGILAYSSAIGGVVLSYIKNQKPTIDLWFNLGALLVMIMYF